ncbi:MAG: hypothetical protein RIT37_51 [Bacteroidota bacterium]
MRYFLVLLCSMFMMEVGFELKAQSFDAKTFIQHETASKLPAMLKQSVHSFTLDKTIAGTIFGSHSKDLQITNFPIGMNLNGTVNLTISPSVIDANTIIMIGNIRVPVPMITTYQGSISGEQGSTVLITYAQGELYGWVSRANGTTVSFAPENVQSDIKKEHVMYNENSLHTALNMPVKSCGTEEYSHTGIKTWEVEAQLKKGEKVLDNRMLEMQVILESTSTFFTKIATRNETRATNLMIAMTNAVNALYRRELNLNIVVPYMQIWTDDNPDPYQNDGANTPSLLNEVQNRWSKITNRTRDIVHCFDAMGNAQAGAGFVAGIANGIGALCNGSLSNAYSVTGVSAFANLPMTTYMKDVSTMAHEIGHNMGSYHTHNCGEWKPALDSCLSSGPSYQGKISYSTETCNTGAPKPIPGSIMSYCDLTNSTGSVPFTFLPRVYEFLRARLESSKCISEVQNAQIKMIGPWGNQTFISGRTTLVEWTSAKVNSVKIQFSTDGGGNWSDVASGIPAASSSMINGQGSYQWTIPPISTTAGRLRVMDMSNPDINDTSWVNFKIVAPSLNLSTNLDGKAFGQSESSSLQWAKTNIDTVVVMFSDDNGTSWETIARPTGSTYTFAMPNIDAEKCWVRIADASNMSLIAQTGPFSIGKEVLTLINPKGGETLCANKRFVIAWTYKNLANSKLLIQYSNAGGAWQNISGANGVDPWSSVIGFTPPSIKSDSIIIRAISRTDSTIIASSGYLSISNEAGCVATTLEEDPTMPTMLIAPNPITGSIFTVTINAPIACGNGTLSLTSLSGSIIHVFGDAYSFSQGMHSMELSLPSISSGRYFLTFQCNGRRISLPVSIEN